MTAGEGRFLRREAGEAGEVHIAAQVLGFSILFALRNLLKCLKRTIVPLVLGGAVLFGLLSVYLSQLGGYLSHPTGEVGSRVLGVAAAIPIVMILIHSLITAILTETVLARTIAGPSFLGIRQWEWRLYVANLGLLLLAVAAFAVFLALFYLIDVVGFSDQVEHIVSYIVVACLALFFFRVWFFVLPICTECGEAGENEILIRSWKQSSGRHALLITVLLPIFMIVYLIQMGMDRLLRVFNVVSFQDVGMSISARIAFLQAHLLLFVGLFGVTYFFATLLITPARLQAYSR